MKADKDSMLYWYPKIKDLPIPQPRTEIIPIKWGWSDDGDSIEIDEKSLNRIKEKAKTFGFPLFIRTEHGSGKHDWKDTCFVEKLSRLERHIKNLILWGLAVDVIGLPCNAIVLREYIEMNNLFIAFWGKMPVNPEIRFFVKDGKVLCWHWYWVEDAIRLPSVENWREILDRCRNSITDKEIEKLSEYAELVSKKLEGYWSVDFCQAKDETWYLIDCALGEKSWHPSCPIREKLMGEGDEAKI